MDSSAEPTVCIRYKNKLFIHKGLAVKQFEAKYSEAPIADARLREFRHTLLIDAVNTNGSAGPVCGGAGRTDGAAEDVG